MLTVTPKAVEKITDFLKTQKEESCIRLFLSDGGCSGPAISMALDEEENNDEVIKEGEITFLVDKTLMEQAKPINIDFVEAETGSGFSISSNLPQGSGCSSCSSCSS